MDIALSLHLQPFVAGVCGVFMIIVAVAIIFHDERKTE